MFYNINWPELIIGGIIGALVAILLQLFYSIWILKWVYKDITGKYRHGNVEVTVKHIRGEIFEILEQGGG